MKAAMLNALGQPLTLEDITEPVPAAGEVLVRVLATPVLAIFAMGHLPRR